MASEKRARGMRAMARDQSAKRKWSRQNAYTTMISARIPNSLAGKLRAYVDHTGDSVSDVIVWGIDTYLAEHSALERAGKEGEGDI